MPAKWQKWMPFHIDSFYGSAWVQAMHPSAQSGYLKLLAAQWQSDDGSISSDDEDLGVLSGLGKWGLWQEYSKSILRHFPKLENGRLRNEVCHQEWEIAKKVFENGQREWTAISEARSKAGKIGNEVRWKSQPDRKAIAKTSQSHRKSIANDRFTGTGTETETYTETLKQVSTPNGVSPRTNSGKLDPLEAIYGEYPRKVGKRLALKAISRAVKRLQSAPMEKRDAEVYLFRRTQSYARSPAGNDGEFTPHPATWFNRDSYDDDPQEWQKMKTERGSNGNQGRNGFSGEQMSELLDSFSGGTADHAH